MSLEGTAENSNVPILKGKITGITVPQIDKTLSKAGQSAEAKATGEAIEKVKEDATEGVNEAKSAAAAANTAALEAKAMVKNSSTTVSMNAPSAEHNVAAGYQLGVMWVRPNYTLHNLAYSKLAEDFVATACVVTRDDFSASSTVTGYGQIDIVGNGDDKIISAALEHGSESGWLYCVVTPDSTAASARVIAGTEEIALTPGEANVIERKFSGTGVTFEATYATANAAETGTIIIDNLTVIDEAATLAQVEADCRDVSDSTVLDFAMCHDAITPDIEVVAISWQHIKDGVWSNVLALHSRFHTRLGEEHLWARYAREIIWDETAGSGGFGNYHSGSNPASQLRTLQCADSWRAYHDEDGETIKLELVNPETVEYTHSNPSVLNSALANKCTIEGDTVVRFNDDLSWTSYDLSNYKCIKLSSGTYTTFSNFRNNDVISGYENSPDKSAYPVDDGCTYIYLGRVGDIARIATDTATEDILNAILGVTE